MSIVAKSAPDPIPYYIRAFAMALPAIMLGLQLSGWIFFLPGAMRGHADFRQLYAAGYMVRTGHSHELLDYASQKHFQDMVVSTEQIALPYIRPAYEALLFVPLSIIPYRAAYFVFLALNFIFLACALRLLRPMLSRLGTIWKPLPEAMFVSFLPTGAALMQGQDSILLLLLLLLAWRALRRKREFSAGVIAGLGLFKFQITIPLAFMLLGWKRWRFFSGFLVCAAVVSGISVWLTGLTSARLYLHSLFRMGSGIAGARNELHYPEPMHRMMNLHSLVYTSMRGHASAFTISLATVVLSVGVLLFILRLGQTQNPDQQFVMAIASAVLLSYYIYIHDLAVLEIPILIILDQTVFALWEGGISFKLLPIFALILFAAPTLIISWAYLFAVPLFLFICLISIQQMRTQADMVPV